MAKHRELTQTGKPLPKFGDRPPMDWFGKNPRAAYVVRVTAHWNHKMTFEIVTTVYGVNAEKCLAVAKKDLGVRKLYFTEHNMDVPDYRVLTPRQLVNLEKKKQENVKARRKGAGAKAAATRKKRGTKPKFTLCHCGAKSKLLYSEMGGLQTRRCTRGHRFEIDKWIADRAVVGIIFGANPLKVMEGMRPRPKK